LAQAKPIIYRGLAKPAFERRDRAVFKIHLNESAQHQLQFRSALLHVYRQFLYSGHRFFHVRFPVLSHLGFEFAVGHSGSLLF
jgi:hypothetical protein